MRANERDLWERLAAGTEEWNRFQLLTVCESCDAVKIDEHRLTYGEVKRLVDHVHLCPECGEWQVRVSRVRISTE